MARSRISDREARPTTRSHPTAPNVRVSTISRWGIGTASSIGSRTWYVGTPETDRFQRDVPGHVLLVDFGGGEGPHVTPIRTGRYQWLIREWRVNDTASFGAELQRLMHQVDPAATLLQLSLVGITSMTDRVAILGRIEHDLRHRLRHLDLRADDFVARPSDDDLASLAREGMLGAAAAKLYAKVRAGEGNAALAKACSNAC